MRTYEIQITGQSPLLMHRDNVEFGDEMSEWRSNPVNKKNSKAGDDRSPAYTWLGCLYDDNDKIVIPTANIMRCLMEGGTQVLVPGGKNGKTFKSQTQSGMGSIDVAWPLLIGGKTLQAAPIFALKEEPTFSKHAAYAVKNGFVLFVKRAPIGTSKHVRVRPKFNSWGAVGTLQIWDEQITTEILESILKVAGEFKGLCDWRPSSRTPGPYGRFTATVKQI